MKFDTPATTNPIDQLKVISAYPLKKHYVLPEIGFNGLSYSRSIKLDCWNARHKAPSAYMARSRHAAPGAKHR